jgi:hypothetical protein
MLQKSQEMVRPTNPSEARIGRYNMSDERGIDFCLQEVQEVLPQRRR